MKNIPTEYALSIPFSANVRNTAAVIPETLGARIRARRVAIGMTQEDLADAARLTQTAVSKIEAGITKPRAVTLEAITRALKLPSDTFADDPEPALRESTSSYVSRALQSAIERVLPEQFPIYDQAAGAGPGVEIADYGFTEPGVQWRDLFGLRVEGQSMEPAVLDGDLLVVARDKAPSVGDVVVASIDGLMIVKRLRKKGRGFVLAGDADGEFPYDESKIEGTVVEIRRRPR